MGYSRTRAHILTWLGTACVAVALFAVTAQAAVTPKISVRKINDYGRIFFSWPEKTRLKASSVGNRITITFDKATKFDPAALPSQLSPYISSANLSADGKILTLSTNHPYKTRQFVSGNATGIDILQLREGNKPPTPPKADAAPKPTIAPKEPVSNTKPKAAAIPAAKPPAPKRVEKLPPLNAPKPKQKPIMAAAKPAIPATKPEPPKAEETASPAKPAEQKKPVEETVAAAPVEPVAQAAPEETPVPEAEPEVSPAEEEIVAAEPEVMEEAKEEEEIVEEAEAPVASNVPDNPDLSAFIAGEEDVTDDPNGPKRLEAVAEMEDKEGLPFLVTVRQVPRGVDVYFPWRERVAAAAYKRYNDIYLVFNSQVKLRLDLLRSLLPASIEAVEQLDVPGHTALRFITDGTVGIAARRRTNGYEWVMNLSTGRRIATNPVEVTPITEGRRPHIFLPVIQDGDTVEVKDPVFGDTVLVRPFFEPGAGIYPTRAYPQFTILESSQGLAVLPKDDATRISGLRNGIRIAAGTHTALSTDLPQLSLAELDMNASGELATLFPYDSWAVKPEEFADARQELERRISESADIRASSLMMKLAQLYLSEGLSVEALGVINSLKAKDPFYYEEQKVTALRGAALFLMDRIPEAAREFQSDGLKDIEEMKLWNEAFRIFLEGGRPRFDYLVYDGPYIDKYPPAMRRKLALVAADNYINRKNYSRATRIFSNLVEDGIAGPIELEMDYLLGKIASENSRFEAAQQLWEPLSEQSENRLVRARAEYSLVAMLYNNGDIDLPEAIARLDALRIVWRGDTLELGLLSQLGQLYIDNIEYLNGLRAWDELVTYFSESAVALDTKGKMAETFEYLFIDDGADEVTPLEALAIFQEFRDLIPVGQKGDVMVQKLADRLASVDLLAWAASLLDHQVKFRLEGEARSRVGTRLALLYLLNKEPQKALDTLELTSFGRNPAELDRQRRRLIAWAFSEIGEPQRAISMLSGDFSEESKSIRLSIYWKMGDWLNVVEMAEDLLGSRANLTAPLNKRETEYLLRLAIAYSFEGDKKQLAYLRDYYGPLIPEENPNRSTLMFVTDERGPVNPTNFAEVTSQISSIEAFMQDYRDQIENAGLSSAFN